MSRKRTIRPASCAGVKGQTPLAFFSRSFSRGRGPSLMRVFTGSINRAKSSGPFVLRSSAEMKGACLIDGQEAGDLDRSNVTLARLGEVVKIKTI